MVLDVLGVNGMDFAECSQPLVCSRSALSQSYVEGHQAIPFSLGREEFRLRFDCLGGGGSPLVHYLVQESPCVLLPWKINENGCQMLNCPLVVVELVA